MGPAQTSDSRPNLAGMANGTKGVDRADPRDDTDASYAGEHGAAAVRFTPGELPELNRSVSAIQIRGARLPDAVLVFSGVEAPRKS